MHQDMRCLYVGELNPEGTCFERMNVLARLGVVSIPFDVKPYYYEVGPKLERMLTYRTKAGRAVVRLNRDLQHLARTESFDAAWIDKGIWIWPETLDVLRKRAKRQIAVHNTPDPQILFHKSRHFFRCIPHYDLLVTTKPYEVQGYKAKGARRILLVLQGYRDLFTPEQAAGTENPELASEVCFVGTCYDGRVDRIRAASRASQNIAVWGDKWPGYTRSRPWLRPIVRGNSIYGERYPAALRATKIALCFLAKCVPETTKTRTFEIPATGTFMLAERTDDHLALFQEGKEAEFFGSDEEMVDKIRFYLANDGARTRIAAAGRERCLKSGYSDEHQLRRMLDAMHELVN